MIAAQRQPIYHDLDEATLAAASDAIVMRLARQREEARACRLRRSMPTTPDQAQSALNAILAPVQNGRVVMTKDQLFKLPDVIDALAVMAAADVNCSTGVRCVSCLGTGTEAYATLSHIGASPLSLLCAACLPHGACVDLARRVHPRMPHHGPPLPARENASSEQAAEGAGADDAAPLPSDRLTHRCACGGILEDVAAPPEAMATCHCQECGVPPGGASAEVTYCGRCAAVTCRGCLSERGRVERAAARACVDLFDWSLSHPAGAAGMPPVLPTAALLVIPGVYDAPVQRLEALKLWLRSALSRQGSTTNRSAVAVYARLVRVMLEREGAALPQRPEAEPEGVAVGAIAVGASVIWHHGVGCDQGKMTGKGSTPAEVIAVSADCSVVTYEILPEGGKATVGSVPVAMLEVAGDLTKPAAASADAAASPAVGDQLPAAAPEPPLAAPVYSEKAVLTAEAVVHGEGDAANKMQGDSAKPSSRPEPYVMSGSSFSQSGIGRQGRQRQRGDASSSEEEEENGGEQSWRDMKYHKAEVHRQRYMADIFRPGDRRRCVNYRLKHWDPPGVLAKQLSGCCTLWPLQATNTAKGVISKLGPVMMRDKSNTDAMVDFFRGHIGLDTDTTDRPEGKRKERYITCQIGPYMNMFEYIEHICYDQSELDQYLKCHIHAVINQNEMIEEQLVVDRCVRNHAETAGHAALEVNECMHNFLEEYFQHLRSLRDRGVQKPLLVSFCRAIHAGFARVVRKTPERNHEHAPISASLRVCRQAEKYLEDHFETPTTVEMLGPTLGLVNTAGIKAMEDRTRSLETKLQEVMSIMKAKPGGGGNPQPPKKKPDVESPGGGDHAPKRGQEGRGGGGRGRGGGRGKGEGRGGGGKGPGDGDRKNVYRQKDHARVDRVVQNAIALFESAGHTPTGDEIKAVKEKLYAKEDALARKT
jgi:hypothetical protein